MSEKNIGIIIQARTGSSRLPGKILLPLHDGNTFLDLLVTRLTTELPKIPVIIATTDNPNDDIIVEHAKKAGVKSFRGSEKNVLDRYATCAAEHGFDTVIRICGDNPFLDIELLDKLIQKYDGEDYLSYGIKDKPSILSHYGFFAEIVTTTALQKANVLGGKCKEHVTNCIYGNAVFFKVKYVPIKIDNKFIRCTLDTQSDFNTLSFLYKNWYLKNEGTQCPHQEIIAYLEKQTILMTKMKNQILINSK